MKTKTGPKGRCDGTAGRGCRTIPTMTVCAILFWAPWQLCLLSSSIWSTLFFTNPAGPERWRVGDFFSPHYLVNVGLPPGIEYTSCRTSLKQQTEFDSNLHVILSLSCLSFSLSTNRGQKSPKIIFKKWSVTLVDNFRRGSLSFKTIVTENDWSSASRQVFCSNQLYNTWCECIPLHAL